MKILISGIVASGKTTLTKKLSASLGIPCYEGDSIAWGFPGKNAVREQMRNRQKESEKLTVREAGSIS